MVLAPLSRPKLASAAWNWARLWCALLISTEGVIWIGWPVFAGGNLWLVLAGHRYIATVATDHSWPSEIYLRSNGDKAQPQQQQQMAKLAVGRTANRVSPSAFLFPFCSLTLSLVNPLSFSLELEPQSYQLLFSCCCCCWFYFAFLLASFSNWLLDCCESVNAVLFGCTLFTAGELIWFKSVFSRYLYQLGLHYHYYYSGVHASQWLFRIQGDGFINWDGEGVSRRQTRDLSSLSLSLFVDPLKISVATKAKAVYTPHYYYCLLERGSSVKSSLNS